MGLNEVPDDIEDRERCSNGLMSNFDHDIDKQIEEELKNNPMKTAEYFGWEFWGLCWYKDNKFYCMTKRYGIIDGVFKADTTEDLMKEVCLVYGDK